MSEEYDPQMDELVPPQFAALGIGPLYFDRQGNPITLRQWCVLHGDPEYVIVAKTLVQDGELEVSTVWLGLDHHVFGGGVEIFETMVFYAHTERTADDGPFPGSEYRPTLDDVQWRYSSEEEARAGHEAIVEALTL